MSKKLVNIFGRGGHASVVISTFFYDDYNICYLDKNDTPNSIYDILVHGIGDNYKRKTIQEEYAQYSWPVYISKLSNVKCDINSIRDGTCIFDNSIVVNGCQIGTGCIINNGAQIDHHCNIGNFVHIAPSATLCGNVKIDDLCLIGANATIVPNIHIGENTIIGAGAVVTKNIEKNKVVVGNPSYTLKENDTCI